MAPNFVREVTGFYRLVNSQHISRNAQLLWFHLFCLWNEAGFPEWLVVDLRRMMCMIQVDEKKTLLRARDELVKKGLLISRRGVSRQPNRYQLQSVAREWGMVPEKKTDLKGGQKAEMTPQTPVQTPVETTPQTTPLYKINHTKPNDKKEKESFGEYDNVLLSRVELLKLQQEFPDTWEDWIRRLDIGKEMRGYQYQNDYAAILNWMEKDDNDARDKAFAELMEECSQIFG
jgi:hypothetical protein